MAFNLTTVTIPELGLKRGKGSALSADASLRRDDPGDRASGRSAGERPDQQRPARASGR